MPSDSNGAGTSLEDVNLNSSSQSYLQQKRQFVRFQRTLMVERLKKPDTFLIKIGNKAVMGSMHHSVLSSKVDLFSKIKHVNHCRIRISDNHHS